MKDVCSEQGIEDQQRQTQDWLLSCVCEGRMINERCMFWTRN